MLTAIIILLIFALLVWRGITLSLRAKDKLDANIIRDYVITTDDFIHDEYHWINLQARNMPWHMTNVLMYYLGVFGFIVSLLWILLLLFRKIQSRKKEYVILIVTLLVSGVYCQCMDIYFFYKGFIKKTT